MKTMNPIQMITNDVRFQTEKGQRFSLRAAAIFIENGSALFATNASRDYYYPIGGAVELGETTQQAALREVSEEIGITCQVNRLLFIQENFFKRDDGAFKDLTCHEITFYFLMKPQEIQKIETHSFTSNNTLTEYTEWLPIDSLDKYDVYPSCLKDKLKDLKPYPEHIITK